MIYPSELEIVEYEEDSCQKDLPLKLREHSNDYSFLLKMFNQRKLPSRQQKKINALIINNIRPYLESIIGDKILD